ncbi:MAG: hypothetical protein CFE21_16210 [Bacteroidetes bacterium B1(2017)]|nr:MAG: hypothetical protein CFE21_16210 [Bacteroidetes bacterium B1(2017)]
MHKVKTINYIVFLYFLLLLPNMCWAQELLFKKIHHGNGLPANSVYRIIQDRRGYLWMATEQGVIRYNGSNFVHYTRRDGLTDNEVVVLKEGEDGKIWFFGYNGSACYWYQDKIYNASSDSSLNAIKTNYSFLDFYEDQHMRKWFLSIGSTVMVDPNSNDPAMERNFDGCTMYYAFGDSLLIFKQKQHESILYCNNQVSVYKQRFIPRNEGFPFRTKDGRIYFFSSDYLIEQTKLEQKICLKLDANLRKSKTLCVSISKDGFVWIASQFGLYCYQQNNLSLAPKIYLPEISFTMVFTDREDNVWVNTPGDGIIQIPAITRKVSYFNPQKGEPNARCYSIAKMTDGNVVIGLNNGKWMNWFPKTNSVLTHETKKPTSEKCFLLQTSAKDVWVGMSLQILHYNAQLKSEHIVPFYNDTQLVSVISVVKSFSYRQGKFFIGAKHGIYEYFPDPNHSTNSKGVYNTKCSCYGKLKWMSDNKIYSVYYSNNKSLWFGTDSGLYVHENGVTRNCSNENTLLQERINCIEETEDSLLLLGTNGMGLLVYKNGKILQHLQMAEGSGSSFCKKISVHGPLIYVLTLNGIFVFRSINGQLVEELPSAMFSLFQQKEINDFFVDGNEIGMAGNQGVYLIPNRFSENNIPRPQTYIEKVFVGDSSFSFKQGLSLNYDNNTFRIQFISIHFQIPERVNYRYRLRSDQAWFYTSGNSVVLPLIEPGSYTFEVQGRIGAGDWSNSASFSFIIMPPFWRETWFVFLCLSVITSISVWLVMRYFKTKIRRKEEQHKIKLRISELEQQALLTMMNPHFLFNVMNSIQSFINTNHPKQANQYLSDFARLIRMNLDISHKKNISLEEELAYLKLYIHFENLRLQKDIFFDIEIDSEIDKEDLFIPAMLIQPFVENAIWHGLRDMNEQGFIKLLFKVNSLNQLEIQILDNGIGVPESLLLDSFLTQANQAKGLSITLQRLCLLHQVTDSRGLIKFTHIYPENAFKGTCVSLCIPL